MAKTKRQFGRLWLYVFCFSALYLCLLGIYLLVTSSDAPMQNILDIPLQKVKQGFNIIRCGRLPIDVTVARTIPNDDPSSLVWRFTTYSEYFCSEEEVLSWEKKYSIINASVPGLLDRIKQDYAEADSLLGKQAIQFPVYMPAYVPPDFSVPDKPSYTSVNGISDKNAIIGQATVITEALHVSGPIISVSLYQQELAPNKGLCERKVYPVATDRCHLIPTGRNDLRLYFYSNDPGQSATYKEYEVYGDKTHISIHVNLNHAYMTQHSLNEIDLFNEFEPQLAKIIGSLKEVSL